MAAREEKERQKQQRKLEQAQENALNDLKRARVAEEVKLTKRIFEDSEIRDNMLLKARQRRYSGYDSTLSDQQNFQENPIFRSAVIAEVRKAYPELFKEVGAQFKSAVSRLQLEWAKQI